MKVKFSLRQQITMLVSLALIVPVLLVSTVTIFKIKSKAEEDIQTYQDDSMDKLKLYLKHITDVAYGTIEVRYQELQQKNITSQSAMDSLLSQTVADLSAVRFDNGEGYFWITDNKVPFPTMIMHAEKPKLAGVTLDDPSYNVEKNAGRNIYQVRAELCNSKGEGFVEYIMKKPGTTEVENKISYSRLVPGLNWIISAGFYTDQIAAAVAEKQEQLNSQINTTIISIAIISLVILGTGLFISLYFSGRLSSAIIAIKEKLKDLGLGRQVDEIKTTRQDEVGDMTKSLNMLVAGLRTYTGFAKDIGQGNLEQSFEPLSEEDVLGNQLIEMRKNLKKASDEKNIRDWVNEGLAKLGDVLRSNTTDTKGLSEDILRETIGYLKVNQGAIFLVSELDNKGHQYLEQTATYAYDRKKFLTKQIEFGEGLIGQCVLEKQTIHLLEIPPNYIQITSGLGTALPETVLIVPLIHNEVVYGVLELASFKKLPDYKIKFVEKVAESIASTVATVQVNERTRKLLEHSQQMSEELKAQEEELRQNQEELQATQEQMQRRQAELERENETLRASLSEANLTSQAA